MSAETQPQLPVITPQPTAAQTAPTPTTTESTPTPPLPVSIVPNGSGEPPPSSTPFPMSMPLHFPPIPVPVPFPMSLPLPSPDDSHSHHRTPNQRRELHPLSQEDVMLLVSWLIDTCPADPRCTYRYSGKHPSPKQWTYRKRGVKDHLKTEHRDFPMPDLISHRYTSYTIQMIVAALENRIRIQNQAKNQPDAVHNATVIHRQPSPVIPAPATTPLPPSQSQVQVQHNPSSSSAAQSAAAAVAAAVAAATAAAGTNPKPSLIVMQAPATVPVLGPQSVPGMVNFLPSPNTRHPMSHTSQTPQSGGKRPFAALSPGSTSVAPPRTRASLDLTRFEHPILTPITHPHMTPQKKPRKSQGPGIATPSRDPQVQQLVTSLLETHNPAARPSLTEQYVTNPVTNTESSSSSSPLLNITNVVPQPQPQHKQTV